MDAAAIATVLKELHAQSVCLVHPAGRCDATRRDARLATLRQMVAAADRLRRHLQELQQALEGGGNDT